MALAAIKGEKLGEDDITDFLAISFSSTDYVGHQFGPNSVELQDTYLRLDQELKRLLDELDRRFKGEYIVFLSSDHGVVNVPLYFEDQKIPGGYLDKQKMTGPLQDRVNEVLGKDEWVNDISNDQIFLNHELIKEKNLNREEVRSQVKDVMLSFEEVADAYTYDDIVVRNSTDLFMKRIENGFNSKRSGDVAVRLKSGYIVNSYGKQGTTHGSGYSYDTHVPILFYGKDVKKGSSVRPISITDIAPTLSMLLNISLPSASTGEPLKELFE
ncbi:MAG: alkaline phosphatase family protein, partial [Bacteroidota bacterium]